MTAGADASRTVAFSATVLLSSCCILVARGRASIPSRALPAPPWASRGGACAAAPATVPGFAGAPKSPWTRMEAATRASRRCAKESACTVLEVLLPLSTLSSLSLVPVLRPPTLPAALPRPLLSLTIESGVPRPPFPSASLLLSPRPLRRLPRQLVALFPSSLFPRLAGFARSPAAAILSPSLATIELLLLSPDV